MDNPPPPGGMMRGTGAMEKGYIEARTTALDGVNIAEKRNCQE